MSAAPDLSPIPSNNPSKNKQQSQSNTPGPKNNFNNQKNASPNNAGCVNGTTDANVVNNLNQQNNNSAFSKAAASAKIETNLDSGSANSSMATSSDNNKPSTVTSRALTVSSTTLNTTNSGSFETSESIGASNEGRRTPNLENLSKTNLYIRGLQTNTTDQDLYEMCCRFGQIMSTKAIIDQTSGFCRGYGFVEFTSSQSAHLAVQELTKSGVQAQMAKISSIHSTHHHHHNNNNNHHHHHNHHQTHNNQNTANNNRNNNGSNHPRNHNSSNNNADPTNLYIANLPPNMSEQELEHLLSTYGSVVSTRILRDQSNIPRGVGFARMESRDKCEQIIEQLNGRPCKGWKEPLLVKFADGGNKKRHHHNSHQYQHHNNSHQHHKIHQEETRWRGDSVGNTNDLADVSIFEHPGNISHSNHLTDLAMLSPMAYPRPQGYPPTVAGGAGYPSPMVPPTSGPQWLHPAAGGQPYVIPQQLIPAGGLPSSNQVAAAALHYGHIPQLTSQMQGLQIGHPGDPVCRYLPPQHQWSALWPHPMPQQQPPPPPQSSDLSIQVSAPLQQNPTATTTATTQQEQSPQPATVQPTNTQQH